MHWFPYGVERNMTYVPTREWDALLAACRRALPIVEWAADVTVTEWSADPANELACAAELKAVLSQQVLANALGPAAAE